MGRPLKIQKLSPNSGVGAPGASVGIDLGFPQFSTLTNPVINSADTLDPSQFLGVVGGAAPTDSPSATFPRIEVIVNVADPTGTGLGDAAGYIIRQKGAHKYLVGDATGVNDGSFVPGQSYQIATLGTTNWKLVGAGSHAAVGTIFTATADDGGGDGVANSVGICVLTDDTTPTAGLMAITYTIGDSTATTVSKLTNKFLNNWANIKNAAGTTLSSYADGGDNAGVITYTGADTLVANFFTDEGTVAKSGAEDATTGSSVSGSGTLFDSSGNSELAIVDNVTS
jgi:hypothetical protein